MRLCAWSGISLSRSARVATGGGITLAGATTRQTCFVGDKTGPQIRDSLWFIILRSFLVDDFFCCRKQGVPHAGKCRTIWRREAEVGRTQKLRRAKRKRY